MYVISAFLFLRLIYTNSDFVTLSDPKEHPYPIVPCTLLGPESYGPFVAGDRSNEYLMIESTPRYVGSPVTFREQHWKKRTWEGEKTEGPRTVGGELFGKSRNIEELSLS